VLRLVSIVTNTTGGYRALAFQGYILRNDANNVNLGGLTRRSYWAGGAALDTQIFAETGYGIFLNVNGSSTAGLSLASTGAATFSNDVTVNGILNNRGSSDNVTEQYYYRDGTYEFGVQKVAGRGTDLFFTGPDTNFNIAQRTTYGTLGGTVRFTVTSGGNVGIGTMSPGNFSGVGFTGPFLDVAGVMQIKGTSANGVAIIQLGGDTYRKATIETSIGTSDPYLAFGTASSGSSSSGTERMRITSSGNILVGTTSAGLNSAKLFVFANSGGTTAEFGINAISGTAIRFSNAQDLGGSITIASGGGTSYNTSSDYRLKEDFKEINGLEKVLAIKTYNYKWKICDERMDGVIAHELAEVIPYAVVGEKDGEQMQGVDYSKIVPVLVKAIQELKAEIDELKAK